MNEKDIDYMASAIQNDISLLSSEILRLIRLPYSSWGNQDRIKSLDKQIEYLEEMLANYERDYKKNV